MDVSRFIRASEDKDAYLAWRDWEGEAEPLSSLPDVADGELCPVPLGELRDFMKKHAVYVWNFATEEWSEAHKDKLYAGMVGVTRSTEGGYTSAEGWSPESKVEVRVVCCDGSTATKEIRPIRRLSRVTGRPYPLTQSRRDAELEIPAVRGTRSMSRTQPRCGWPPQDTTGEKHTQYFRRTLHPATTILGFSR